MLFRRSVNYSFFEATKKKPSKEDQENPSELNHSLPQRAQSQDGPIVE